MTVTARDTASPSLNDLVRTEIRVAMARKQISNTELAMMLGEDKVWVGRRITQSTRIVPLDMHDVERIARALGVEWSTLFPGPDGGVTVRREGIEPPTRWFGRSPSQTPLLGLAA